MRVAALYDIHGNLLALEAVLAEVRREHGPPWAERMLEVFTRAASHEA